MYLTITDDRTNEVLAQRAVSATEPMDCDEAARDFAKTHYDTTLDISGLHVFLGCADFTVEFAETPGSSVCWATKSYYLGASHG